jgi:hypothetical protein
LLLLSGLMASLAQNGGLEQGTALTWAGGVNRFALAIGAFPMLETARIGGDARFP